MFASRGTSEILMRQFPDVDMVISRNMAGFFPVMDITDVKEVHFFGQMIPVPNGGREPTRHGAG